MNDTVRSLSDAGKSYRMLLPDLETDYIQKSLAQSGVPYEVDMLRDMAARLAPGDQVVDVGANIGNHSLYLAAIAGAKVASFEPNAHLASALAQSVELNNLDGSVTVHAEGVGSQAGTAAFGAPMPENLGGQSLVTGGGDIPVVTLDSQRFDGRVSMIKIDVEGMELEVLKGARDLIARDRPILYIESATEADFRSILGFLKDQGYLFWDTFNATPTHLFMPGETVTIEQHLYHAKTREALDHYKTTLTLDRLRKDLNNANLKYRTASSQVAEARDALKQETARAARDKEDAAAQIGARDATIAELRRNVSDLTAALELADRKDRESGERIERLHEELAAAVARAEDLDDRVAILRAEAARAGNRPAGTGNDTGDDSAGAGISVGLVAAWVSSLPVAAQDVARRWLDLAGRLQDHYPAQALNLLRTAHLVLPDDIRVARRLGVMLLERGRAREALEILEPVADRIALSSREARALALARGGMDGPALRAGMAGAVRSPLRVAAIMDEFTASGYAPECDLQQLSPDNWRQELEDFRPGLLLVESAWRGLRDEWAAKVGQSSAEVRGILDWCKARRIPTVFWNKEDPVHFETFLTTAQRFDIVLTTDIDCIPRYKASLGHDRVHLLPFACQPEIHNPLEIGPRKKAFCFAGAYYVRYPDRTRDLDDFLARLSEYHPFEIFDRNFGKDHPDYMFPEGYRKHIVGTLPPSEIDRAYKGYEFGINLNSVKNSQSMFARRVYELLASNTRIVSNYSPGLRLMFGDLVISTDSGAEALRRIRKQDAAGMAARVRLAGLRKALSEHTYGHRLARIARHAGLALPDASVLPPVTVLARADTRSEAEGLLAQVRRQNLPGTRMVLVLPADIDLGAAAPLDLRRLTPQEAARTCLGDLVEPDGWLAGFAPGDHYGPNYLTDLVLATRYSAATVLGKAAYHRYVDGNVTPVEGPVYAPAGQLAARRAMVRASVLADTRLDDWLRRLPDAVLAEDGMLGLDPFGYCEGGAADPAAAAIAVDDLAGVDAGIAMDALAALADGLPPAPRTEIAAPFLPGAVLAADMAMPRSGKVSWTTDENGAWHLSSTLGGDEHVYIYERQGRPLSELRGADGACRVHALVGPGLNTLFVAVWQDADRQKLGHQVIPSNRNTLLAPPEGTEHVCFGIRPRGPGGCTVSALVLGDHLLAPRPVVSGSRVLLLTNHYPSHDDLYRNGFVHSRVRAYREIGGITPDVYRLRPGQDLTWHEFQNIDCMTGSEEQLDFLLASGRYDHVLVHFLDKAMWQVLARHVDRVRVTVWVHGAEVQPWWRRVFNYGTEDALQKAKTDSDARLAFWRGIFDPLPKNLHFVFVSQYFADEVFEDLQVACPPGQYRIIHNPIDDALFAYREKPVEQRGRILSIRPFASPKYANDLSVKAILSLQDKDFFKDLEFRIIGDGPLFDEITAPLAGLPNVICERGFLSQNQIAALQRDYGVFLNPTRWDSHGVSRDEAMSSGLVPVTNRVAAIPEFVDETCGYLAEPDDAEGLADAIADLWKNPDTFRAKSRAAAERVRRQSGKHKVIAAELAAFGMKPLDTGPAPAGPVPAVPAAAGNAAKGYKSYDSGAWNLEIRDHEDLEGFLESGLPGEGIVRIGTGTGGIEFMIGDLQARNAGDFLIVGFTGAMTTRTTATAPFFSGQNLARSLGLPFLCFADPVVSHNPDLALGWYAGDEGHTDLPRRIGRVIDHVASLLGAMPILVGGSGGGFAAMNVLRFVSVPARGLANNPQTRIASFAPSSVRNYVDAAFPGKWVADEDRLAASLEQAGMLQDVQAVSYPDSHWLLYLQNESDGHHVDRHLAPYLEHGTWERHGENLMFSRDRRAMVYRAGWGTEKDGHVAPPRNLVLRALQVLMNRDGSGQQDDFHAALDPVARLADGLTLIRKDPVHKAKAVATLRNGEVTVLVDRTELPDTMRFAFYFNEYGISAATRWYSDQASAVFPTDVADPKFLSVAVFLKDGDDEPEVMPIPVLAGADDAPH